MCQILSNISPEFQITIIISEKCYCRVEHLYGFNSNIARKDDNWCLQVKARSEGVPVLE